MIDFIERMERCSTHEAILKAKAMIEPTAGPASNGQAVTLHGVFARFKKSFFQSGKARAYLKQRGWAPQIPTVCWRASMQIS